MNYHPNSNVQLKMHTCRWCHHSRHHWRRCICICHHHRWCWRHWEKHRSCRSWSHCSHTGKYLPLSEWTVVVTKIVLTTFAVKVRPFPNYCRSAARGSKETGTNLYNGNSKLYSNFVISANAHYLHNIVQEYRCNSLYSMMTK